jgi:S1-C subfamily serine protease
MATPPIAPTVPLPPLPPFPRIEPLRPPPPPPPPTGTPRRRQWVKVSAVIWAVVMLLGLGFVIGHLVADDDTSAERPAPATVPTVNAPTGLPAQPGPVADDAAEPVAAVAAVVSLSVVRIDTPDGATGSGIVFDSEGYIVTNAHVVNGVDNVVVQLADGTRVPGTVVGLDPAVDVGVVHIDLSGISSPDPAVFAPSEAIEVGQLAVAIGSPFGLEQSVTAGIVSAVNRAITNVNVVTGDPTAVEMVQTDAPINPGNSGGALADRQGRVVGMNTSIRTDGTVQGNLGVGFAIPSDTVVLIANRIISGESLASGFLGVGLQDPTVGRAGAQVTNVVDGSPASLSGLRPGDLIVRMDGQSVPGTAQLAARVKLSQPGVSVQLEVIRDGDITEVTVVLGTLGG